MNKKERRKRKRQLKIAGIAGVGLLVLGLVSGVATYTLGRPVYKKCIFEAGTQIEATDFLKKEGKKVAFKEDISNIDTTVPGEYTVKLKSGLFTYKSTVVIQDTIAPKAEAVDVFFEEGQTIEPEQFLTNIEDATAVKVEYGREPDFNSHRNQRVELILTDAGNNQTSITASLFVRVVAEKLEVEAGSDFPDIKQFLLVEPNDEDEFSFYTLPETVDMHEVGESPIYITANGIEHTTILHIKDTKAPVVEGKNQTIYIGDTVACEDFIKSAKDATKLSYAFVKEPNLNEAGEQTVSIVVTDEGGNSVQKDVKLKVLKDTEAPNIKGAYDFSVLLGDSISYKSGITVTDNHDESVSLKVDNSKVNPNAVGTYPVTYTATDKAGNTTTVTVNLKIIENLYTESTVNELADKVLKQIIKPGMKDHQKLKAIYNWVRSSIAYTNSSDKGDWLKAAYEGMKNKKGDCYTYASTAKALLTRAGINNKDIKKIPSKTSHYWNLVNIGEGWYHFDTTPRKGQTISFCYISDADLMAYSKANNNSHNYDRDVYTNIE